MAYTQSGSPSVPIAGVSNPLAGVANVTGSLTAHEIASVVLAIMFIFWVVYTLVATYHLLRYGHRSWFALPAVIVHVVVSAMLALFAVSGLA